ncbi:C-type lectin domain family 4 member F-like [Ambystoma mexicanum]|uniref:C-type lectin domain family 4 member F-like n=1 Tax=Ambystoma mexicanum TaxID=8296 RepID=UPI0037E8E20F
MEEAMEIDTIYQNYQIYQNVEDAKDSSRKGPGDDYHPYTPTTPSHPDIAAKDRTTGGIRMIASIVLMITLSISLVTVIVIYYQEHTYLKDVAHKTQKMSGSLKMGNSSSISEQDHFGFQIMVNLAEIQAEFQALQDCNASAQEHKFQLLRNQENASRALTAMQEEFKDALSKLEEGWKINGNHLYFFSTDKRSWDDAEKFCVSQRAHLTSVTTEEEQNFLNSKRGKANYHWIGLTDQGSEGNWRFVDGSSYGKLMKWSAGSPDNWKGSEHCAHLLKDGRWNDCDCPSLFKWICKKPFAV